MSQWAAFVQDFLQFTASFRSCKFFILKVLTAIIVVRRTLLTTAVEDEPVGCVCPRLSSAHSEFLPSSHSSMGYSSAFVIPARNSSSVTPNQTVNDGVAHSKNPRKCAYHVTFDVDLDLEHTLDACLPGDHRVKVWSRSGHLPGRRSNFRASTKVPVSRDL